MIGAIIGIVGALWSGYSSYKSGKEQKKLLEERAELILTEGKRQASVIRRDAREFAQTQTMDYVSAGVEYYGTPLLVIEDTMRKADEEAEAILAQAAAGSESVLANAATAGNEGKARMISSMFQAAGSGYNTVSGAYTRAQANRLSSN